MQDIYNAMEAAEDFVSDCTFEDFIEDTKTQYAVIRALEIIGEEAKNVPMMSGKSTLLFRGKIWQVLES